MLPIYIDLRIVLSVPQYDDGIADTPVHLKPNKGDIDPDTCGIGENINSCEQQPGLDPVDNFMNQISPSCMQRFGKFTPLQIGKMEGQFRDKRHEKDSGVPLAKPAATCKNLVKKFGECGCMRIKAVEDCVAREAWRHCNPPNDQYITNVYKQYLSECAITECVDDVALSKECKCQEGKKIPKKCVLSKAKKFCNKAVSKKTTALWKYAPIC